MMMFLTWEAQWLNFVTELQRNLTAPALVVPVMDRLTMQARVASVLMIFDVSLLVGIRWRGGECDH